MPSMFLPLHFTTSHCIVHNPAHPPIFTPRLGFASLSSPTMAQPGTSHSFTPMEDLPSATSSVAAFKPEDRHLRHFLLKTREPTGLSSKQLPIPSLGGGGRPHSCREHHPSPFLLYDPCHGLCVKTSRGAPSRKE